MRKVFAGFAGILALAVMVQFFFAAVGAFDTAPKDESFDLHRMLGMGIILWAALTTIVAALARMPGPVIGRAGAVTGLAVVQILIRVLADAFNESGDTTTTAGTLVFGLHALNGLAIMVLAGNLASQSKAAPTTPASAAATEGDATPAGPTQPAS